MRLRFEVDGHHLASLASFRDKNKNHFNNKCHRVYLTPFTFWMTPIKIYTLYNKHLCYWGGKPPERLKCSTANRQMTARTRSSDSKWSLAADGKQSGGQQASDQSDPGDRGSDGAVTEVLIVAAPQSRVADVALDADRRARSDNGDYTDRFSNGFLVRRYRQGNCEKLNAGWYPSNVSLKLNTYKTRPMSP